MMACRHSSSDQPEVEKELELNPYEREKWALAAQKLRTLENGDEGKFEYPDLDCYSRFFAENAESSKTVTLDHRHKLMIGCV